MEKAHHTEALETMEAVEVKRHHMKATEAHHTEAHRHHWPRPSHLKREGRDRGDHHTSTKKAEALEKAHRHQCHHRGHHHHRHQ